MSYLAGLTLRLAAGAMQFDDAMRRRHAAWLAGAQRADGGFPGREGPADLYYTGFGLRGLALLDALTEPIANRVAAFLRARLAQDFSQDFRSLEDFGSLRAKPQAAFAPMPSIDFISLVLSAALLEAMAGIDVFADAGLDRREAVLHVTEPLRRDDGGFAKSAPQDFRSLQDFGSLRGRSAQPRVAVPRSLQAVPRSRSSTYQTFLVIACRQLVGIPIEDGDRVAALVRSRQRGDGGFVEMDRLPHSGTNPTAAAVGLLRILGALDGPTRKSAAEFLVSMQGVEGGFRANTRVPLADLLSTFTGLAALDDLDSLAAVDLAAVRRYVAALEMPDGGFRAGAWDDRADVEYNSYGLGAMALLNVAEEGVGE
jgi:geranylgeranyl transferase type-2 subunit beta